MNGRQSDPGLQVAAYNGDHVLAGVFGLGRVQRAHGRRVGHRDGGATLGLLLEPAEQRAVLDVSLAGVFRSRFEFFGFRFSFFRLRLRLPLLRRFNGDREGRRGNILAQVSYVLRESAPAATAAP